VERVVHKMKAVYPLAPPRFHFLARTLVLQSFFFGNQAGGPQDELALLQSSLHMGQPGSVGDKEVSLAGVANQELAIDMEDAERETGDDLLQEAVSLQVQVKGLEAVMALKIEGGVLEEYVKDKKKGSKKTG